MGICLGKFKRNRVSPSIMEESIRIRRSKASVKHQLPDLINPADMKKQLEEAEAEESRFTRGGLSFTVDPREGDPSRMPSRLADRLDGAVTPPEDCQEIQYTAEERELLAELLRNDILRERSITARRDIHAFDAARRRAAKKS